MKIAVATKNGFDVDMHFGQTESFVIYSIKKHTAQKERRGVESYADPRAIATHNHPFNAARFEKVKQCINDCDKVIVSKIGKTPALKLHEAGIIPIIFDGKILDIVRAIQKEEL
ncbi:MAG: hypothetical protein OCC49_17130 [Fibrobacterales bacterium]